MVSTFRSVSLKRQRPFPGTSPNTTNEVPEVSLVNFHDSGQTSRRNNQVLQLHLKGSSDTDERMLKSRFNRILFASRHIIVSMLNNKGVICMERKQYEEARKSLDRALHLAGNQDQKMNTPKSNFDSNEEARVCASISMPSGQNRIEDNCKNDATSLNADRNFKSERKQCFMVGRTKSTHTTDEASMLNWSPEKEVLTISIDSNATESCSSPNEKSNVSEALKPLKKNSTHEMLNSFKGASSKTSLSSRQTSPTKSEYEEGMDCFKSSFRLLNSSQSLNGTILFNLGRLSHNQERYQDALVFYKRSLLTIEQRSPRDEALILAILAGIGKIHYAQGDHIHSLNIYMTALALARSHHGENSLEVAACLNCIGVLHYMMSTGDDDIAMDALQTSLQQRIRILGKDHIDVGTTWNNVGRMYFQLGKLDSAMEAYCEALRIRRKCQGESVDVAATLFNCGQVYHSLECRVKALSLFRDFLKLAKIHFGEFHRDVCIVATCIGQVLHESKDYENAIKFFQYALRIGHVALGPVHSEMAITLNKIGNLYYETGDFDSALNTYHQGLEIEIQVLETGNPNTYVTYTNIAEIHKQKGDYVHALEYYQKVYELQIHHDAETLELANTLSNIGYTKQQLKDLDGALEANQECLRLRRDAFGDTHEDVASTLTHVASVLLKLERHHIALQLFMEAYRIRKTIPVPDTSSLAFTIYNIAHIYHHQGSHDNALKYYLATAEVEKGLGIAHLDLSITYYNIGQLFYQRGEMKLALIKFKEALEIERECYGANHPNCARTLNEIGNIELQLGNVKGMMTSLTKALRIYKEAGMFNETVVVYGLRLWRFNITHPEAAAVA